MYVVNVHPPSDGSARFVLSILEKIYFIPCTAAYYTSAPFSHLLKLLDKKAVESV